MAKFTKEFMQDIISGNGFGVAPSAVADMARQLLASMEQEPVAYNDPFTFKNFATFRAGETDNKRMGREWVWANPDAGLIPLYAAPQLPQPAVANEVLKRIEHEANHVTAWHHIDEHSCKVNRRDLLTLVNACRAAMLQGAETVQGWIPCSERMPKVGEYVLCLDGLDRYGQFAHDDVYTAAYCNRLDAFTTEYYGDHDWMSKSNPTHWAPIPKITAAPQQEVKK